MGNETQAEGNSGSDRSNETLTPKTAYRLTKEQGLTQTEVGDMFGVTQPRVSTLVSQYEEAKQEGRESVSPDDFSREELESVLADEEPEDNPFESVECPACGADIAKGEAPNSAGKHPCPHCGTKIEWGEDEIP